MNKSIFSVSAHPAYSSNNSCGFCSYHSHSLISLELTYNVVLVSGVQQIGVCVCVCVCIWTGKNEKKRNLKIIEK